MFVDLDWPLNASSLLSASAELLVGLPIRIWQRLRYSVVWKFFYIVAHLHSRQSALNYCSGIFFKSVSIYTSRAHKLYRQFLNFSKFLTAISRKLWRHLATKNENLVVHLKEQSILEKCWKPCQNRPINRHTILDWTIWKISAANLRILWPFTDLTIQIV